MANSPDPLVVGRAKGGLARAAGMSREERKRSAQLAAEARWEKAREKEREYEQLVEADDVLPPQPDMPIARHRGVLNIIGLEVPCYVLDNGEKIIGRTSATELLTGIRGGGALEKYISVRALEPFINSGLVLERMVPFRLLEVEGLEKAVKGLPADLMIEVCQGFVAALQASMDPASPYPRMTNRQKQMALQASMFLSSCAKIGLEALIDEATGYQYEREEDALQVKLQAFIAEELRAWEKTFPDELWQEFGRVTLAGVVDFDSRPKWWGKLVRELIYDTLDPDIAKYIRENKPPAGVHWHRQLTETSVFALLCRDATRWWGWRKPVSSMRELRDRVAEHYGRELVQLTLSLPRKPN